MNEEVKELKAELALLKLQFSERIRRVEQRLNAINAHSNSAEQQPGLEPMPVTVRAAGIVATTVRSGTEPTERQPSKSYQSRPTQPQIQPAKPNYLQLLFHTLFSAIFDWFSPVAKIYQSYKARNMLGIFSLTIIGIALTLAGFGYLMQLLIDQLGVGAKSLLLALAAVSTIALGILLNIKTRYGEFATAIVSLGLLLAYSTIYFVGSVYHLVGSATTLALYLLVALSCYALAMLLETKVVATLGIVGISMMPILSRTVQFEHLYYLLSLAFVVAVGLVLCYRRVGHWLAGLSLAFSVLAIEWTLGIEALEPSVWVTNLFYVMFFVYAVVALQKDNASQSSVLKFLAAAVGANIALFWQSAPFTANAVSISFALNTLLAVVIVALFQKAKHELTNAMVLVAALWGVLTIISVFSEAYWGMAWAVEGLLLIYIGRLYVLMAVVHQGQALTTLALLYCWSALARYFPLPALQSTDGWLLSVVIVAVLALWQRMLNAGEKVFDQVTVIKIKPLLQLTEVIWLSVLIIASAAIWLGHWAGASVIVLQLAILFRARYCRQVAIDYFAVLLILVPLYYVQQGAQQVNSYLFTELPLFAQMALLSAFLQLWLWAAFYRRYHPGNPLSHYAEKVRILFYLLLPVCWLAAAMRRLDNNVLMVLWLSPLMALVLAYKIKHRLLLLEARITVVLASMALIAGMGSLTVSYGIVAVAGFILTYAGGYWLDKRQRSPEISPIFCSCGIVTLGMVLPEFVLFQLHSLFAAMLLAASYWGGCFYAVSRSDYLTRLERPIALMNALLLLLAWGLTMVSYYYVVVPCMLLVACLMNKTERFDLSWPARLLAEKKEMLLHSIAAISYCLCFSALSASRLDLLIAPVLAIHGATILFINDNRLIMIRYAFALVLLGIVKLALIDAANALLWQKVSLFMGIGVFILFASFWYQKLTKRNERQIGELDV